MALSPDGDLRQDIHGRPDSTRPRDRTGLRGISASLLYMDKGMCSMAGIYPKRLEFEPCLKGCNLGVISVFGGSQSQTVNPDLLIAFLVAASRLGI
jgi:hypothetical protein